MNKHKFLILLCLLAFAGVLSWESMPANAQQVGFNPNVNYALPNFAYSPNIQKFVDKLPGIGAAGCNVSTPAGTGTCNENENGQYIPLAVPDTSTYPDADYYVLAIKNYTQKMHRDLGPTMLRGYSQVNTADPMISASQYLGPMILARSYDPTKPPGVNGNGKPVRIMYENLLPTGAAGKLFIPVDTNYMGAGVGPVTGLNFTQNRIAVHLHGGHTPWISDGTPQQWITPANDPSVLGQPLYQKGQSFQNVPDMAPGPSIAAPSSSDGKGTLYYSNQQSSRLLFYHDHAYGITRLNVYAGLAAPYLITSQVEDDMIDGTNVSGAFAAPKKVLPNLGGVYRYGIPLVIQDKSFVNDSTTAATATANGVSAANQSPLTLNVDPLWSSYVPAAAFTGGSLWWPHEYMPNENIYAASGANPLGRWDYGPWLNPPLVPIFTTLPSPSGTPESFMDTMVVNGTPFPYLNVPPTAVRFRILSVGNDRVLNLSWFLADPASPNNSEVKMVSAAPNAAYPTWPKDGRLGGVPDPTTQGPSWYQIQNESGWLPQVAVMAPQPVDFEYSRLVPTFGNVTSTSLLLMPAMRADVVVDFSAYAGKTLILYNDGPAPMPLYDDRYDIAINKGDFTTTGGTPPIQPGFGPNTRTVMQVRVANTTPSAAFDLASLQTALPQAFKAEQPVPIVKQAVYGPAYGTTYADTFVNNTDATINLTGAPQAVSRIVTTLPGSGFTTPPSVSIISANGAGSGALAAAGLDGIGGITVTVAGAGYTSAPTVAIAPPTGCTINTSTCVSATATASISGGQVTAITIVDPGAGYTPGCAVGALPALVNPAVTLTGGGFTTAATVQATISCGTVAHIGVTNGGSGFTKAPYVFLSGGGGKGATASAILVGDTPIDMKNITEGFDPWFGKLNVQLGTTPVALNPTAVAPAVPGIAQYIDPPSDYWYDDTVQVFRIAHLGVDSHAVHFHLTDLQIINRVDFTNTMLPPEANEVGWRETIRTNPFTDVIVAARPRSMVLPFAIPQSQRLLDTTTVAGSTANYIQPAPVPGVATPAGTSNVLTNFNWEYVWHCHLLGHEENDMMRTIVFNPSLMAAPTSTPAAITTPGPPHWTHGTAVTFTSGAVSPVPTGTLYYRFSLNDGTTTTLKQNYSTTTTWHMLATQPVGKYTLIVDVATSTTAAVPYATAVYDFYIINTAASGVTLTSNVASPHINGTAITFTAAGTGSSGYYYRFNKNGVVVQDWSTTATYTLPLSTPAGTYAMTADVYAFPSLTGNPDATSAVTNYTVTEGRDFNGDGLPDLLWRNSTNPVGTSTGDDFVWEMNGVNIIGGVFLPTVADPTWTIVGVGDFNGDGHPDLVWRNTTSGLNFVWYMNGVTETGGAFLPTVADPTWTIVGVGDFNGDGQPDLVWRNTTSGLNFVWYMNGVTETGGAFLPTVADPTWTIVGVADFKQDGHSDILWRNTVSGQNVVWYMNGATLVSIDNLPTNADPAWKIEGVLDLNGDGKPDILWRNTTTGANMVWYMDGVNLISTANLTPVADQNWSIVGH